MIQGVETEYKPWGGLAGVYSGDKAYQMDMANREAVEAAQLQNTLKQVEAGRASADFANPEMEQARQQGILGENLGKYSDGQLKYSTLDSNTKTKLAEGLASSSKAEIDATINGLDQFNSIIEANGPAGLSMALQTLPPQYQQMVQKLGPEQSVRYAREISNMLKDARADSASFRGKLMEQENQGDITAGIHASDRKSAERVAGMQIQGNKDLEQMRIDAGKYNKVGTQKTVEQALLNSKSAKQSAEILDQAANYANSNGDVQSAIDYSRRAADARARAAEDYSNQGVAGKQSGINIAQQAGLPTNPAPTAVAPIGSQRQVPTSTQSINSGSKKFNPKTGKWE